MPMRKYVSFLLAIIAINFTACVKDDIQKVVKSYSEDDYALLSQHLKLPEEPFDYTVELPSHLGGFPVFVDRHQATLGRVLFYDKNLSSNGKVSCASCHKAEFAFGDNAAKSQGVAVERTSRNSLSLAAFPSFSGHYNFFGGGRLFWDERVFSVFEQAEQSFLNPLEMGASHMDEIVARVQQQSYYDILLKKAFPGDDFSTDRDKVLIAIQSFVHALGTTKSRFDQELSRRSDQFSDFGGFSAEENLGKSIFNNHCQSCHNLGSSSGSILTVANNGLEMDYKDPGVGGITAMPADLGVFKIPMLRNIALTAPYMHDGRFATLDEVVEHYSSGVENHPNLNELLKSGGSPRHLNLSSPEKKALVAFLQTLTDEETLQHERFSDPFR
jgi:cytochrome c peroxidase